MACVDLVRMVSVNWIVIYSEQYMFLWRWEASLVSIPEWCMFTLSSIHWKQRNNGKEIDCWKLSKCHCVTLMYIYKPKKHILGTLHSIKKSPNFHIVCDYFKGNINGHWHCLSILIFEASQAIRNHSQWYMQVADLHYQSHVCRRPPRYLLT